MLTLNFTPFPTLTTQRLVLREITADDKEEVFALRSNKELMKYIPRPLAQNIDDALSHIAMIQDNLAKNEILTWGISLKDDPRLIGFICYIRIQPENYRSEVGYLLHEDHHGKGIMDETLKAVLDYGFGPLGFNSVNAVVDPENIASSKLLEKNGFVKEGHFREDCYWEGKFLDSVHYGLLARNYKG